MDDIMELMRETGVALRHEMLARGATDKQIRAVAPCWSSFIVSDMGRTRPRSNGLRLQAVERPPTVLRGGAAGDARPEWRSPTRPPLIAHGINVWGADLSSVHVTRLDGACGRTCAGIRHHEGTVVDDADLCCDPVGASGDNAIAGRGRARIGVVSRLRLVSADDALNKGTLRA
jgi:hypothetical protein